jgi:rod shape determining protein RodA
MINKYFRNFDWILLGVSFLVLILGLLVLYSTTYSEGGLFSSKMVVQAISGIIGFIGIIIIANIDYRVYKKFSGLLYVAAIALLLLVEIFGFSILGATRWIDLGFTQIQPSEIAKILVIISLAKFFAERNDEMWRVKNIIISAIYAFIPMLLVIRQPDLGTALVIFAIWAGMLFISNVKRITLLKIGLAGILTTPLGWLMLRDYQKERILSFLSPEADVLGKGWNVSQAVIAIGSGRLFGRGLGYGPQSHLNFLPMQQTDFAFAVLAEEMGFIGVFILLSLFFIMLIRTIKIASESRDNFGSFISVGVAMMIAFHVFVNIGMNLRLMPVTGLPLPFISYGGTSLLTNLLAIGLLQSIYARRKQIDF